MLATCRLQLAYLAHEHHWAWFNRAGCAFDHRRIFHPKLRYFCIGGAVAFILGSLFLFDPNQSAFHVANWLIALMAIITGFAVYIVMYFAMRSHMQKPVSGGDMLIGLSAKALCAFDAHTPGQVLIQGSAYRAETKDTIAVQQTVYIVNVRGIVVIVSATPPKER